MDEQELAEALAVARRGHGVGFAVLWRSLQPALLRYLRVVVGEAAEDVASETWLQAARDIRGFTGDVPAFRVWLFRIARHRGIDEQRRAARRLETPTGLTGTDDGITERDTALDVLDRSATDWALRLIASLPPSQAEAVLLRVVAGLSVAQAATVLGKRPGTVRVAAMRGLRRLANHPQVQRRQVGRPRAGGGPRSA
ncbi:RNA polymerase sigma factor [Dactylosporangium darangshiense]|uniref:RNA polymerase sigma factor n=1 Tax=Dactylosporangium darangshiense TaxID=579108 RepID=A0ABP8DVX0_9ACTN